MRLGRRGAKMHAIPRKNAIWKTKWWLHFTPNRNEMQKNYREVEANVRSRLYTSDGTGSPNWNWGFGGSRNSMLIGSSTHSWWVGTQKSVFQGTQNQSKKCIRVECNVEKDFLHFPPNFQSTEVVEKLWIIIKNGYNFIGKFNLHSTHFQPDWFGVPENPFFMYLTHY